MTHRWLVMWLLVVCKHVAAQWQLMFAAFGYRGGGNRQLYQQVLQQASCQARWIPRVWEALWSDHLHLLVAPVFQEVEF